MVGGYAHRRCHCGAVTYGPALGDIATIDSELRLVAALRRAAGERGGPLPSIDVADALLDERRVGGPPSTPLSSPPHPYPVARRAAAGVMWCAAHEQ